MTDRRETTGRTKEGGRHAGNRGGATRTPYLPLDLGPKTAESVGSLVQGVLLFDSVRLLGQGSGKGSGEGGGGSGAGYQHVYLFE